MLGRRGAAGTLPPLCVALDIGRELREGDGVVHALPGRGRATGAVQATGPVLRGIYPEEALVSTRALPGSCGVSTNVLLWHLLAFAAVAA